jgi:hypothetical protein
MLIPLRNYASSLQQLSWKRKITWHLRRTVCCWRQLKNQTRTPGIRSRGESNCDVRSESRIGPGTAWIRIAKFGLSWESNLGLPEYEPWRSTESRIEHGTARIWTVTFGPSRGSNLEPPEYGLRSSVQVENRIWNQVNMDREVRPESRIEWIEPEIS